MIITIEKSGGSNEHGTLIIELVALESTAVLFLALLNLHTFYSAIF